MRRARLDIIPYRLDLSYPKRLNQFFEKSQANLFAKCFRR